MLEKRKKITAFNFKYETSDRTGSRRRAAPAERQMTVQRGVTQRGRKQTI